MAGLLDIFDNDQARFGLSLLAAAGPQERPMSFGQRMAGAVSAFDQQKRAAEERQAMQAYREMQMEAMRQQAAERERTLAASGQLQQQLMTADPSGRLAMLGQLDPKGAAQMLMPQRPQIGNVEPGKYTPESMARFAQTNDFSVLVPRDKREFVNGMAVDPYAVQPGAVVPDPNKPFMLGQNGQPVPNQPFQQFELNKAAAGSTRVNVPVSVNTEKQFAGTMATEVGKQVAASAQEASGAQSALLAIGRIEDAFSSGKVVSGPMSTPQLLLRQVGEASGFAGHNNAETLANTRTAIQGLSQLSLDAAKQLAGQGAITERERELLSRAASGDINMTQPELQALMGVLRKSSETKIMAHQRNVEALRQVPGAAPIVPFFQMQGGGAPQAPAGMLTRAVKRFNPQTGMIEDVRE